MPSNANGIKLVSSTDTFTHDDWVEMSLLANAASDNFCNRGIT
jgi:hypothetical protein